MKKKLEMRVARTNRYIYMYIKGPMCTVCVVNLIRFGGGLNFIQPKRERARGTDSLSYMDNFRE